MATTQAMCTSFKSELMQAVHNFKTTGGNTFKLALYTSSDIISTISYFLQKNLDLKNTVINIDFIVQQVNILVASNEDFMELNKMILEKIEEDSTLKIDYEDCMQLFLAQKHKIKNMLTSDKKFCKGIKQKYDILVVSLDDML